MTENWKQIKDMRKYCVFTSVGDHSNVLTWFHEKHKNSDWDFIFAFYGDNEEEFDKLSSFARYAEKIKGGKFQNLKKIYEEKPEIFESYDYILLCDDDIIFQTGNIFDLFRFAAEKDFWVCQPAFDQSGRVSHKITAWRGSNYSYRIVNFVEMTCPVFRSDKLFAFLKEYDGELVGWGIDWWYSSFLSGPHSKKFAVIDDVVVLNPHDHQRRGGAREITKLQPNHIREAMWKRKSQEKNIAEYAHRNISEIKNSDLLFMAQMDKFQLLLETETIPNRDLILSSFHVLKTEMGSILDDLSACRAEVASSKKQM